MELAAYTEDVLELRTEGLVKKYGKRTVVNDVSFNVRQGEIVGLLGPNGAGKTTSFYMTTGLVVPNAGHIYLGDQEITDYPVYQRARAGIGYLGLSHNGAASEEAAPISSGGTGLREP